MGSRISATTVPGRMPQRAARPEQAGIERDRHAGHAFGDVEMGDAEFVARLGADRPPRAFRKDDELAVAGELDAGALGHALSACTPAPRSTGTMRPLIVYQPKIGTHCNSRFMMKVGLRNSGSSAKISQAD